MILLLGADDAEIFKRIRLEALRAEPESFASSVEDWESLPDDEWLRRTTGNPVFVAFANGEPVGIMGLLPEQSSKMRHRATLIMVYVRRSMRGGGLAKALLEHAIEHARANGIRQLELAVTGENLAAIRFYDREGFVEIGRIPGGFLHEGREIDDVLMMKRIDR